MSDDAPSPDFGPGGYLPQKASKRARKIVLRAPLGMQWILAAAAFGAVVLVGGLLWLNSSGPPGPPHVAAGPVDPGAGPAVIHLDDVDAWLVTGAGPPMAVVGDQVEDLSWCEASRRLESSDGRVWTTTGRGLGTPSLTTHPMVVHDGVAYVDPTATRPGARPSDTTATPAC